MAEKKQAQTDEETQAASDAAPGVPSETGQTARNPVDLGTDVDNLPPVPGAGQFMEADQHSEDIAQADSGGSSSKRG